jgi:hypothetical protein
VYIIGDWSQIVLHPIFRRLAFRRTLGIQERFPARFLDSDSDKFVNIVEYGGKNGHQQKMQQQDKFAIPSFFEAICLCN